MGNGFPGLGPKPTKYQRVGMSIFRKKKTKSAEQEIISELEWLKGLLEVAENTVTRKNIHARAQLLLYKLEEMAIKEVA